jgi:bifunctional DNase/RNase
MMEEMKRVRVMGVAMPSELESPVVILEDDDGASEFCVSVGAAEAGAILMELEGVSTPRPLTHELMAQLFREQGLSLRRVELYGVQGSDEDGFIARLLYGRGLRSWTREVRPSDALALAVTTGAPIYAHRSAFDRPPADIDTALSVALTDGYWSRNQKRA